MKVCFIGASKTGSNSIWAMMRKHPQISTSFPKEPLQFTMIKKDKYIIPYTEYDFSNYTDYYNINDKTKVLFDFTVNVLFYVKNIVTRLYQQPYVENVCCIYVYRNTIDKFFSAVNDLTRLYLVRKSYKYKPKFLNENLTINNEHLTRWVKDEGDQYNFLCRIESQLGKGNTLIIPLSEVEDRQNEMYDFLEVNNQYKFQLKKLNQYKDSKKNVLSLKVNLNVIRWFKDNFDMMKKLSKENERMIHKKWGIKLNERYDEQKYRKYFSIC